MKHEKKQKLNIWKVILVVDILAIIIFAIYVAVCKPAESNDVKENIDRQETEQSEAIKEDSGVANIIAIGDTLCHSQNFNYV